jgi:hypothetical protein
MGIQAFASCFLGLPLQTHALHISATECVIAALCDSYVAHQEAFQNVALQLLFIMISQLKRYSSDQAASSVKGRNGFLSESKQNVQCT